MKLSVLNNIITWCGEGRKLVEEVRVFLLAAQSGHCTDVQWQVSDQLTGRQLIQLQDVFHVMDIVDQQVALVHTGHEACSSL